MYNQHGYEPHTSLISNHGRRRDKSRERNGDSGRVPDYERDFNSLAFFDIDINDQQPPLLTSERKNKTKSAKSKGGEKVREEGRSKSSRNNDPERWSPGHLPEDTAPYFFQSSRIGVNESQ